MNLWEGRSAEAVLKSYLQAKKEEEEKRQQAANDRLSIYHDDWEEILEQMLSEQFHPENYKNIRIAKNTSQNIVKKVVNEISILYKDAPVRDFNGNKKLEEIYSALKIDNLMRQVNRYATLLNDVALRVGWDADKKEVTLNIHTPAATSVIQRDDYPEQAGGVYYPVEYVDDQFKTKKDWVFWSDFEHFLFDERGNAKPPSEDNGDMANPYGIIPFVWVHLSAVPGLFWNGSGGSDLITGTKLIGLKRTLKDYYYKWQTFKQPWVKAPNAKDLPDKMLTDPSSPWKLWGEGADVGFLDLQGDLRQLDETIKADMNAFLNTYGLSVDMFAATPDAQSGRSLEVKNRGLRDLRQEQMPFFRNFETELCRMIVKVFNTYNKGGLPEDLADKFAIDFAEMDVFIDPMERRKQAAWDLEHGIISPAAFYKQFNPDAGTDEEAEKLIIDNMAKLKEMQGQGFSISKYFGDEQENA